MPYPTAEQLRLLMRLPAWTGEQEATADLLLELAVGVVEDETGQALEAATETVILDGTGTTKLVLPRWPVTAVTAVTIRGDDEDDQVLVHGADHDYTWSAAGILTRIGGLWPCHDQAVEVEVTAGFSVIPPGVRRIVLRLSAAAWSNPSSLTAETLGDLSRSFNAADIGMELSDKDRRTLGAYRART